MAFSKLILEKKTASPRLLNTTGIKPHHQANLNQG
jgi:hypothetical protein